MALSLQQFIDQVAGSSLMSVTDIAAAIGELPLPQRPADAEQLARLLVKEKRLTAYQAQQCFAGKGKSLVLGNYILLDKLGQGGMGMVLKAQHKRMKRIVALKVLAPNVAKDQALIARFHREVEAAARLAHPNIVAAYDADEANHTSFLVMEYVEGTDLSSLVKKKGPLPIEQAIQCILQAAKGLEYAHKQGVIHRDIKPANLLLDREGTVKILDMGLARIEGDTAGKAELTSTGAVMGTVDYMAPEQALSTKHANARSDIYSLGIALWYLCKACPAYEGDSLMARLLAHREAPIPSLVPSNAPANSTIVKWTALDAVFRKMVAKKPEDRYQSMTEVVAALEACQRGDAATPQMSIGPGEDSRLDQFLAKLDTGPTRGEGTLASPVVSKAEVTKPLEAVSQFEATVDASDHEVPTDPQTLTSLPPRVGSPQPRRRRTGPNSSSGSDWWRDRRVHWGAAVAAILLLAAVSFRGGSEPPSPNEPSSPTGTVPSRAGAVADGLSGGAASPSSTAHETGSAESTGPNYALRFTAASAGFQLPPELQYDSSLPITIEAWVLPAASTAGDSTLRHIMGSRVLSLDVSPQDQELALTVWTEKSAYFSRKAQRPTPAGDWIHVAASIENNTMKLFINGQCCLVEQLDGRIATHDPALSRFIIGDGPEGGTRRFLGLIDEIRISKSARYGFDFTPQRRLDADADTLALYHFDEGTGERIADTSKQRHHATLKALSWGVSPEWVRVDAPVPRSIDGAPTLSSSSGRPADVQDGNTASSAAKPSPREVLTSPDWEWSPPVNLGATINSEIDELDPSISADGLTLLFLAKRPGAATGGELWLSTRNSVEGSFGAPQRLETINSGTGDSYPSLTSDSKTLYFTSLRPGGAGTADIWVAHRESLTQPFAEPALIAAGINTPAVETDFRPFDQGRRAIFARGPNVTTRSYDLYQTARSPVDGTFTTPQSLGPNVNTPGYERNPWISEDGTALIFTAANPRSGGYGTEDLWLAVREGLSSEFGPAVNLGSIVNSPGQDIGPSFHSPSQTLYFVSSRPGGYGGRDIWTSRRVRRATPAATRPVPANDWITLFDGSGDTSAWPSLGPFQVQNGLLVANSKGVAVAQGSYTDFELEFEWRLAAAGNSGLYYRTDAAAVGGNYSYPGTEFQLLDNAGHPDGKNPKTSAGSLYGVVAPSRDVTKPAGEWNTSRVVALGNSIEHWVNGEQVVRYEIGTPEWKQALSEAKNDSIRQNVGRPSGNILLQGHTGEIAFRNMRIRRMSLVGAAAPDAGSPTGNPPKANVGLQFDGVDDHVVVDSLNLADYPPDQPLTIEATVRPTKPQIGNVLSWLGDNWLALYTMEGSWGLGRLLGTPQLVSGAQPTALGETVRVAGVWNNRQWTLYFNGQRQELRPVNFNIVPTSGGLYLGGVPRDKLTGHTEGRWFGGEISEVRLSKTARYTDASYPVVDRLTPDAETIALYEFSQRSGEVLKDVSGHGHDGKIVGATWVGAPQATASEATTTNSMALQLTGNPLRDYVQLPPEIQFDVTKPGAVEIWIEDRQLKSGTILALAGKQEVLYLQFISQDRVQLVVVPELKLGTMSKLMRFGSGVVPDGPVHLAVSWSGQGGYRYYVNGQKLGSATELLFEFPERYRSSIGLPNESPLVDSGHSYATIRQVRISSTDRYTQAFVPDAQLTADADTLALYRCNEGSGDVLHDSSGHGHDGRLIGAKWVAIGEPLPTITTRNSLSLDGIDDRVEFAPLNNVDWPLTLEFVADELVALNGATAVPFAFDHGDGDARRALKVMLTGGKRLSVTATTGNNTVVRSFPLLRRTPQHVAIVIDNGEPACFVNGRRQVLEDHPFQSRGRGLPAFFLIGCIPKSGNPGGEFWQGRMSGLRLSQGAAYVQDFTPQPLTLTAETIALYDFSTGAGDVVRDLSGHGHDGRILGAEWVRAPLASTPSVPPQPSGLPALLFDGQDDHVDLSQLDLLTDDDLTMDVIVSDFRPRGEHQSLLAFDQYRDAERQARRIQLNADGILHLLRDRNDETRVTTIPWRWSEGTHRLTVHWQRDAILLYVDGELQATRPYKFKSPRTRPSFGMLGAVPSIEYSDQEYPWSGELHGLRIARGLIVPPKGDDQLRLDSTPETIALYDFSQGGGDVLKDLSGHGHDGKIVGPTWVRGDAPAVSSATGPTVDGWSLATERSVAEWVLAHKGSLNVQLLNESWEWVPLKASDALPATPFVVKQVDLRDGQVQSDADVARLVPCRYLESLTLTSADGTAESLRLMQQLPQLADLALASHKTLKSSDLAALKDCRSLATISITSEMVNDRLESIRQLGPLNKLNIYGANPPDISGLAASKNLRSVLLTTPDAVDDSTLAAVHQQHPDLRIVVGWQGKYRIVGRDAAQATAIELIGRGATIMGGQNYWQSADHPLQPGDFQPDRVWSFSLQRLPETLQLAESDYRRIGLLNAYHLSIERQKNSDELARALSQSRGCATLTFDGCDLTDAGLEHLRALAGLRMLTIFGAQVTRDGVERLHQSLPHTRINTDFGVFDADFMQAFRPVANTGDRDREIAEWAIGKGGGVFWDGAPKFMITDVSQLPTEPFAVRALYFVNVPVTVEDLQRMAQLPGLRKLSLHGSGATDAGLRHFQALQQLNEVQVFKCPVTDQSIPVLASLPSLTSVNLSSTQITAAGIRELARLRPEINRWHLVGNKDVDDATLRILLALPSLLELDVRRTGATRAGVEAVRTAHPQVMLQCDFDAP